MTSKWWRDDAACAKHDTDLWFPDTGSGIGRDTTNYARNICAACPVQAACLNEALKLPNMHQHGIFGGLTADERLAIRRRKETAA